MYHPTETELKEMKFKYDKYVKWWEIMTCVGTLVYNEDKEWILYDEDKCTIKPESKEDIETLIRLLK